MARIKAFEYSSLRYLLVAVILAGGLAPAVSAHAEDGAADTPSGGSSSGGGYSWMLGGSPDSDSGTDKSPSGPYIPPSPPPAKVTHDQKPPAQSEVKDNAAAAPSQQFTPSPTSPSVINDLGMASVVYAPQPTIPPPPGADFSTLKHYDVHGKPAMVYMVEQQIKQAKDIASDKKLSDSDRKAKEKQAYDNLARYSAALHAKQRTPDSIYKSMKMTDQYIQEEKDNSAAALKEVDAALKDLKSYQ